MFKRVQGATAESNFMDSNLFNVTPKKESHHSSGFVDSSLDLRDGAEVKEFDTIPAELLDLFR
jgi:hypothetical protein